MPDVPPPILCLSHLPWEERLFQRPQQLMLHLDELGCEVLYLAPLSSRRWLRLAPAERCLSFGKRGRALTLPFLPLSGRLAAAAGGTRRLLYHWARPFAESHRESTVLWLQHPFFTNLTGRIPHKRLVYDCMDPFGAFAASGLETLETEKRLLGMADLVFTGGRSLHKQREHLNPRTHCFPSGIDFDHFSRAAAQGHVPPDLPAGGKPRLGYIGAIDERIDWDLVRALCRAGEWSVIFIGPLVGIERCPVDERNFEWLGPRRYCELPDYLRGIDVALIPWLVNDLTRFMSPTKTPEYLAAGCPVVSTPIPDVVADYGEDVRVAGRETFAEACLAALGEKKDRPVKPPASRTWSEIAEEILALLTADQPGGSEARS